METNAENIKKLQFWTELPLEIMDGVFKELFRTTVVVKPIQEASIQYHPEYDLEVQ